MKICSKCKKTKSYEDFSLSGKSKDGYCYFCKECAKDVSKEWVLTNPSRRAKNQKEYHERKKEILSEKRRFRIYGLTPKDFTEIISKQKGKCALCEIPFKSKKFTHIDHCHATGKVRGILCMKCNVLIGYMEKNNHLLEKIRIYQTI